MEKVYVHPASVTVFTIRCVTRGYVVTGHNADFPQGWGVVVASAGEAEALADVGGGYWL